MRKFVCSLALLSALVGQASAADPVYVVRPPVSQLRANVLPANAFGSTSSGSTTSPSNPSTPAAPEYVFKSYAYDNVTGSPATFTSTVGKEFKVPIPSTGDCDMSESAEGTRLQYLVYYRLGSNMVVKPLKAGKMAFVVFCDGVSGLPNGFYQAKNIVTVN